MRRLSLLIVVVLLGACSDDGPSTSTAEQPNRSSTTAATAPEGPVAGPTTSSTVPAECAMVADRYVEVAREFFGAAPTDQATEVARARFAELDQIALAGGCGEAYRQAVCDGLDELTLSGTLVIYPLVTARCI